jgi:hypothetical protein
MRKIKEETQKYFVESGTLWGLESWEFSGLCCEGSMTLSLWGMWVTHYFQLYNCFIMSTPTFFCSWPKKRPIVDTKSPPENKSIIIHLKYLRLFWGALYFIWGWKAIFYTRKGVKSFWVLKIPRKALHLLSPWQHSKLVFYFFKCHVFLHTVCLFTETWVLSL